MSQPSDVELLRKTLARDLKSDVDPLSNPVKNEFETAIEFVRTDRQWYVGEVGKKDGSFIYHFFPKTVDVLPRFEAALTEAMLKVFKFSDRLLSKHDEIRKCTSETCGFWADVRDIETIGCPDCGSDLYISMSSWAVKAVGFADTPLADDRAISVFDALDERLGG